MRLRPSRRTIRSAAIGAGLLVAAGLGGAGGLGLYVESLGPLDLSPLHHRSVEVLDREGRLLRPFASDQGRWRLPVAAAAVDPRYLTLLKTFEDRRFDRHHGIDPLAMLRAAAQMLRRGRVVSGGSTLTMQVARLLEPRSERSLSAKLRQMVRAVELERRFTKDEILGLYLSLAPFGGNLEGVRAASLAYFGREPKRLSTAQAALLVALPQSPEARRPDRRPEAARLARDRVLDRAAAAGLLTGSEAAAAKHDRIPTERRSFPMLAAHRAEEALTERPNETVHRLTIEARLQQALESLAKERLARLDPHLSAAILVVDNATGEIRASVGSADYGDLARAGAIDMTRALRSPGSALKPFVYALAFENGIAHPETLVDDRPTRYGGYRPENFDLAFQGTVTARKALQMSLNVPAVELLAALGPARLLARLQQTGVPVVVPKEAPPGLAIGLGGLGITLSDLTRLYGGLARAGKLPRLRVRADEPSSTAAPGPAGPAFTDPVSAWYVADILRGAPPPDNALAGRLAFKTGTSYGYRDAWAVGFDRATTIGVWVGRPDNGAVPGLVGRAVAAPILFDAFARLGGATEFVEKPAMALVATTASLPPPLRHLRKDVPKTLAATVQAPLKITFPLDGSRLDLGLTAGPARAGDVPTALVMKAAGGVPPLTWLVNGAPVDRPDARRQAAWRPDGAGFVRLSVMDARGTTDSVVVRVE